MKLILSLIAITISANLFAQTKEITNWDSYLGIKEKYHVLESDKNIKEGAYTAYTISDDKLICKGYYKNNLKDSIWNYYSRLNKLAEFGKYLNGEKVGVWNAYDSNDDLEVQFDYTNKKLLTYNRSKSDTANRQYYVINGNDTLKTFLSRPPIFLDGEGKYVPGIHYPQVAREKNIQGKVLVAFTIDLNGKTSNFRIKKSLGYGCDEEALKAVKNSLSGDWLPGLLNGNAVIIDYEVPANFSIQQDYR